MVQVECVETGHVLNGLPRYPVAIRKEKKRNISSEWIYLIDRHCAKIGHLFFSSGETREYLLKVIAAVETDSPHDG